MQNFTRLQQATILTGCLGLTANSLALVLHNEPLGYLALCLGRLSGLLYMVVFDKFRSYYLFPLAVSATNIFVNSEFMVFAELLAASFIYQISAFHSFSKMNK